MPTSLVNTLTLLCATIAITACSNAYAEKDSAETNSARTSATSATAHTAESSLNIAPSANIAPSDAQDDSITRASDLARVQGNPSATLWVVEISDFQCPYCKEWHETVFPKLREEFIKTGKIRFAYLNFPLSMHKNALPASRAAMCAGVQGKFWEMQDGIFAAQNKWADLADPTSFFEGLAKGLGINVASWKSCIDSKSIQARIDADYARAKELRVRSTPSFMIGSRLVEGLVPIEDLRKMINAALEKK
jgi:protein-disulfide isomerase